MEKKYLSLSESCLISTEDIAYINGTIKFNENNINLKTIDVYIKYYSGHYITINSVNYHTWKVLSENFNKEVGYFRILNGKHHSYVNMSRMKVVDFNKDTNTTTFAFDKENVGCMELETQNDFVFLDFKKYVNI